MNKRAMSPVTLVILITALTIGYVVTHQTGFDVNKFTSELKWKDMNITTETQPEVGNALTYYINGMGAAYFEVMKWVAKFSVQNPNVPYKLLLWLIIISTLIPILYYLFLAIVVIVLLTKEWINIRKEKKELEWNQKKK